MSNRALAGALIALALAMKLIVPAGFMPTVSDGRIVIGICSGTGPMTMVIALPGVEHGKSDDSQHNKAEQPCAFGSLSAPFLGAVDPILLALAVLFVMALALRPMARRAAAERPHLRPPLRGPPVAL